MHCHMAFSFSIQRKNANYFQVEVIKRLSVSEAISLKSTKLVEKLSKTSIISAGRLRSSGYVCHGEAKGDDHALPTNALHLIIIVDVKYFSLIQKKATGIVT